MSRQGFKLLSVLVVLVFLASAFYVYRRAEDYQTRIDTASAMREQLKRELQETSQLSASLADLDNLTINENGITRLDVLRHLGLENSTLSFNLDNRSERVLGNTTLIIRQFTLSGELPYAEALQQVDWLQSTKKVVLDTITLRPGGDYGDRVSFSIRGTLYGLDKGKR